MQRKDKEKKKHKNEDHYIKKAKKEVLDWKLDFNDKKLNTLYEERYNAVLVTYLRLIRWRRRWDRSYNCYFQSRYYYARGDISCRNPTFVSIQ